MHTKVSVIIVSYNVVNFLEQCLYSVETALGVLKSKPGFQSEIIVVDNVSGDNSAQMIQEKFPDVVLIENSENLGFSKANNIGYKKAEGEYILIINPDTLMPENLFTEIVDYMDKQPKVGALGVKMLDANGNFQTESKRAYPTPMRAFGKLFGLGKLFPKSKYFNGYHMNQLKPDEVHNVEILSGAFMFIRRSVIEKIGLFDEDFFMYGEDIDLSYRILQAGYKNTYYGKISILHYKGESTKTDSHRYIRIFYEAMQIFIKKHFAKKSIIINKLLCFAVSLRAMLAHGNLFFKNIMRKTGMFSANKMPENNFLVVGNPKDVEAVRAVFCNKNNSCKIQAVYHPERELNIYELCKIIQEINRKIKTHTIVVNIKLYKPSLFFCLLGELSHKKINFYTIANNRQTLIGNKTYNVPKHTEKHIQNCSSLPMLVYNKKNNQSK